MAQEYIVQIETDGKWKSAYRGADKAEADSTYHSSVAEFGSDAIRILKSSGTKEDGSTNWVTAKTPVNLESQPEPEPAPEPEQDKAPQQPIKGASGDSPKPVRAAATPPSTYSVSESYKQSFDFIRLLFASLWKLLKAWLGTPKKAILFFVTAGIWAIPSTVKSMKDGELTKKELWLGLLGYMAVIFTFGVGIVLIWCGNALWLFFRQFQGKQLSPRQFGLASALPALILYSLFFGEATYIAFLSPAEKHEYLFVREASRQFSMSRADAKPYFEIIQEQGLNGEEIISDASRLKQSRSGLAGWESLSVALLFKVRGESIDKFLATYGPFLGDWSNQCTGIGRVFTRTRVDIKGVVKSGMVSEDSMTNALVSRFSPMSRVSAISVNYRPDGGGPAELLPGFVVHGPYGPKTFVLKARQIRVWEAADSQRTPSSPVISVRGGVSYSSSGKFPKQTPWSSLCQ